MKHNYFYLDFVGIDLLDYNPISRTTNLFVHLPHFTIPNVLVVEQSILFQMQNIKCSVYLGLLTTNNTLSLSSTTSCESLLPIPLEPNNNKHLPLLKSLPTPSSLLPQLVLNTATYINLQQAIGC